MSCSKICGAVAQTNIKCAKQGFNLTLNSTDDHTMPFEYGRLMTGVICHMADLKRRHLEDDTERHFYCHLKEDL